MNGHESGTGGAGRRAQGWWEQKHRGRQAMEPLSLSISAGVVRGQGRDLVAPFTLEGTIDARGAVAIVKRYRNAHVVHYVGMYDGEGGLAGRWHLDGDEGRWQIVLRGDAAGAAELDGVEAIEPLPRG